MGRRGGRFRSSLRLVTAAEIGRHARPGPTDQRPAALNPPPGAGAAPGDRARVLAQWPEVPPSGSTHAKIWAIDLGHLTYHDLDLFYDIDRAEHVDVMYRLVNGWLAS